MHLIQNENPSRPKIHQLLIFYLRLCFHYHPSSQICHFKFFLHVITPFQDFIPFDFVVLIARVLTIFCIARFTEMSSIFWYILDNSLHFSASSRAHAFSCKVYCFFLGLTRLRNLIVFIFKFVPVGSHLFSPDFPLLYILLQTSMPQSYTYP